MLDLNKNNFLKIHIKCKSFHYKNFKIFIMKTLKKINDENLIFNKIHLIQLPIKIQRFIVIRSPHIDKKSREHFEIRTYQKLIVIFLRNKNLKNLKMFLNFLKNSSAGMQIKITFF